MNKNYFQNWEYDLNKAKDRIKRSNDATLTILELADKMTLSEGDANILVKTSSMLHTVKKDYFKNDILSKGSKQILFNVFDNIHNVYENVKHTELIEKTNAYFTDIFTDILVLLKDF